jgi:hypothetical protein
MILEASQLSEIVLHPDTVKINKGSAYSKRLRMHINGANISSFISEIEGFEREPIKKLRIKYAKSNKDLFARLSRPIDKIFSARDGSIYLNLSSDLEKKAISIASNIHNGYSIKKWLEMFWMPHMLDDPFGIIFMEMMKQTDAVIAQQQGRSFVYPVYIPSSNIITYKTKGNKLDYIVLRLTEEEKKQNNFDNKLQYFRVVDDAFDYFVKVEDQKAIILDSYTMPNYFGEVPGMLNSDIIDPENEGCPLSFFDHAIELADHFFLKGSIKITHDFLHGFAKYVEFASDCNECTGTGFKGADKCSACSGSGKKPMTRVSDVKLLNWPTREDTLVKPSEAGGYIEPSKTYHDIATADMSDLENMMSVTLWGAESKIKTQGTSIDNQGTTKTATEVMGDIKPEADRLHILSEMAEIRHKFILDFAIRLQVSQNYSGASVNYGRRYMLEGPDAIWLKYSDARAKGAPQNVLDDLLNEYYDAKYMTDPVGLAIAKKLIYVEPFVHYTAQQLKALNPAEEDYKAKLYFSEWLSELREEQLLTKTKEQLKTELKTFASGKKLLEQQKLPTAA